MWTSDGLYLTDGVDVDTLLYSHGPTKVYSTTNGEIWKLKRGKTAKHEIDVLKTLQKAPRPLTSAPPVLSWVSIDPHWTLLRFEALPHAVPARQDTSILSNPHTYVRFAQFLSRACFELNGCGWVHRDVKPDNVLLLPDVEGGGGLRDVVLLDYDTAAPPTATSSCGTTGYRAPEVYDPSKGADWRADLYGVGATVARLLCLRMGEKGEKTWRAHTGTLMMLEKNRMAHLQKEYSSNGLLQATRYMVQAIVTHLEEGYGSRSARAINILLSQLLQWDPAMRCRGRSPFDIFCALKLLSDEVKDTDKRALSFDISVSPEVPKRCGSPTHPEHPEDWN